MANLLYNDKHIIGRLYKYSSEYFATFPVPTAETLFSACAVYTGNGICPLHTVSFHTFFVQYYREIAQCFLLCLFLCKSRLFTIHECNGIHGSETDSRTLESQV